MVLGLELGADDYVTKPFSPRVLVSRVRAVLRRRSERVGASEKLLEAGGLSVDTERYEVLAAGESLVLTVTEFKILEFLMRGKGRVYDRYQIIDAVRGEDVIVIDRTVDVHIAALRKRLGSYGDLIETVRGVGYRFAGVEA